MKNLEPCETLNREKLRIVRNLEPWEK